jgi:hypothetical protein
MTPVYRSVDSRYTDRYVYGEFSHTPAEGEAMPVVQVSVEALTAAHGVRTEDKKQ